MIATKIGRRIARVQAAFDGKAATDIEIQAAVAWQRTTRRIAAAIARELNHDPKTFQDFGNVESGDRGPHLNLLLVTQLALEWRGDRDEALAALDFVEQQLGRVAIELPPAKRVTPAERSKQIAFAVLQLGEFLDLASLDQLSPEQVARLHQEKQDLVQAIESLFPSQPAPIEPETGGNVRTLRGVRS